MVDRILEDFNDSVQPYWVNSEKHDRMKKLVDDEGNLRIELDVSHFRPEELAVNVREGELCVEGHHKERSNEHGSVERHFVRKYTLPEDVLQESIESQLSDQGILQIYGKVKTIEGSQFKKIPIQTTVVSDNNSKK